MKPIFILVILYSFQAFSQTNLNNDSIPAFQVKFINSNYKDFIVIDKLVYAISNGDSLISINLKDNTTLFLQSNIKGIAKTSKNKLIALTSNGQVIFKQNNEEFIVVDTFLGLPYKILIDKNDEPIIITTEYLRFNKKNYLPQKSSSMYTKAGTYSKKKKSLIPIDVYYIDKENRVWFGYDAGEWGGDVCIFDLNKKEFLTEDKLYFLFDDKYDKWPKNDFELLKEFPDKIKIINGDTITKFPYNINISNIKGITQNLKGHYYIATSLMHFDITSNLSKLIPTTEKDFFKQQDISDVLNHEITAQRTETYQDKDGVIKTMVIPEYKTSLEYLGGITFNIYDNSIYYYTNNGFWKLKDINATFSKELLFKPWIYWKAGMPDAVGYQMNVKKFEFISEKELVFLTSSNGIGFFNGTTVTYFQ